MKNLKKVLALALAVIMVMSMFTVAFAAETETKLVASDFTDWNEVENKDAVALAVDLGIISGISNGDGTYKYAPKESIDRASWSKILYFLATGDDDASAYQGANVGLTDISTSWAEGFIAYVVANGYMDGDGNGHYMPASNITVAGGLKTMMTVLGYDSEKEKFLGVTWEANVMTMAKQLELLDGLDKKIKAGVSLTRDMAAQLIYNALQTNTVIPNTLRDNGIEYVNNYSSGGLLCWTKFDVKPTTITVDAVVGGIVTDCSIVTAGFNTVAAAKVIKAEVKASVSNQGEDVLIFTEADGTVVSTSVASTGAAADYTFTAGVDLEDVLGKNGDDEDDYVGLPAETSISVYSNGTASTITWDGNDESKISVAVATNTAAKKAGNKVEVFTNDDGEVTMLKITNYSVAEVGEDAVETRTYKGDLQVKIDGVSAVATWTDASKVEGYQGLEEGDRVYFYTSNGTTVIAKAEKVTGTVSQLKKSKIYVDGTAYGESGLIATSGAISGWDVAAEKGNVYDFYLDLNGTIFDYELVEGDSANEWAYVLQAKFLTNAGTTWDSDSAIQAKLLFTDGTTEIVNLAEYTYDDAGTDTTVEADDFNTADDNGATDIGRIEDNFVKYGVDKDGNYKLTVQTTTQANGGSTEKIKNEITFTTTDTVKANNSTLFLVEKTDANGKNPVYTVYTGFKNVPKMDSATVSYTTDANSVASYVFLATQQMSVDGTDGLIYVIDADDKTVDVDGNETYTVIAADGSEEDMTLKIVTGSIGSKTFYIVDSIDTDGVATVKAVSGSNYVEKKDDDNSGNKLVANDGFISYGTSDFEFDNDTVAVMINIDKDGDFVSAGSFSLAKFAEDTGYDYAGYIVKDSNSYAEYVYIVCTEQA